MSKMEEKSLVWIENATALMSICTFLSIPVAIIAAIAGSSSERPTLDLLIRIPFVISPLLFLTAALGMTSMKTWARILSISLSLIAGLILLVYAALSIIDFQSYPFAILFATACLISIFLFGKVVYYLTRSDIKE